MRRILAAVVVPAVPRGLVPLSRAVKGVLPVTAGSARSKLSPTAGRTIVTEHKAVAYPSA